ncbi:MAG: thioredoxin family protein [Rhodothermales bacterium]|nr:thioredoxin family protein [Rhodothermales bacterium]
MNTTLQLHVVLLAAMLWNLTACERRTDANAQEPPSTPAATPKKVETTPAPTPAPSSKSVSLKLGDRAPMLREKMRNVDGEMVTIESSAGARGTLVIFTCNHCPWSQAWEGRIAKLGNTYDPRGIGVVAINSNDPSVFPIDGFEAMQARARQLSLEFPYAMDVTSNIARAYGAKKTPEVYLFDAEQRLVYHGAVDDNPDIADVSQHFLKDALDALLADQPVEVAETRAIGCSIKFR